MSLELVCFSCGAKNSYKDRVGRREECHQCRADLHCCKNCRYYDSRAYNECRETSADVVREKEESNFCDFFEPGSGQYQKNERESLLAQAEALFGKKGE